MQMDDPVFTFDLRPSTMHVMRPRRPQPGRDAWLRAIVRGLGPIERRASRTHCANDEFRSAQQCSSEPAASSTASVLLCDHAL